MKIILDIPDTLIAEALKRSNQKTKSTVVIQALEAFIRKQRIQKLKCYKGRINFDINLDLLRDRKWV